MPKRLKKTVDITTTVLLILFVVFVILLVGVRLFGIQPHIVLSGSMEPEILTGSLVYVAELSAEERQNLQPDDTVTYQVDQKGTKVTHKIYNVVGPIAIYETDSNGNPKQDENGEPIVKSYATDQNGETIVMYTTYGINNNGTLDGDPEKGNLASSNIVGKPLFSIPLLGYVANYVQSPFGRYVAFSVCLMLVALTLFSSSLGKKEKEEAQAAPASKEGTDSTEQEETKDEGKQP